MQILDQLKFLDIKPLEFAFGTEISIFVRKAAE
jgi:hypothetical protein